MITPPREADPDRTPPGRAHVSTLISPHPLGSYLPALYHEDDFAQSFMEGLDGVLAPIFNTIDNVDAYLDPRLAPLDFLEWLGTWMGLVADETWPVDRRRAFVSEASALYRMRGTRRGLAAHVQIFSGGRVEVVEQGRTGWSTKSGAAIPGTTAFDLLVRVYVDNPAMVDVAGLDALVAAAKPAHLAHRVEVLPTAPPPAPSPASPPPAGPSPAAPQHRPREASNGPPNASPMPPPDQTT